MKTYSEEQMRELMTDAEWKIMGMIMFDNCTVEDKQAAFSLYLQEKERTNLLKKKIKELGQIIHVAPAIVNDLFADIDQEVKNEH